MSSRKKHLASLERQVKRLLGRRNLDLLQPLKPSLKVQEHGGYKVRDAASGAIVFGEAGYEFSASLEEVEAWIEALES